MRNVFDQYSQPENKLTHALISTLHNDRKLIKPFLHWAGIRNVPPLKTLRLEEQQVPGEEAESEKEGQDGLPDGTVFNNEWAVLIEAKVQAGISVLQLRRHRRTAARYGYEDVPIILLAVDKPKGKLPRDVHYRAWREVYGWFWRRSDHSPWAKRFAEYMQVFESRMLARDYDIRGTITMFSGFKFDDEKPYTYRQGKQLMRLMGQEFRANKQLVRQLGLDPKGNGRPALTKGKDGIVWDIIPLKIAKNSNFTAYPHATMALWPSEASVAITVPNGIKGGLKTKLRERGFEAFEQLIMQVERRMRPIVKVVPDVRPHIYVLQRHYKSQRSQPTTDARLDLDLRVVVEQPNKRIKYQPMWLESVYKIMSEKRANIQLGFEVYFPYKAAAMQDEGAVGVMAVAWIAMKPVLDFVLD